MTLIGTFIGIDRFADPTIRELSGCRRDALALWSLFSDTVPDMQAELLLDEQATTAAILAAFDKTLGVAGPDDAVILSFSAHGTADHRLVTHDTDRSRYADTTIDMGQLAKRFKETRAKIVFCILDCCFSGGAPARVLEDTPITRGADLALESIAGAGRILIAASNVNEPALELGRHGLLTRALFEALQAESETVSLPTVMDAVMQRVRAEAARMGYVQTPVLLGHVEGGVTLPSLKRGPKYFAAFPEAKGARVSPAIGDLSVFGITAELVNGWKELYPSGLNSLQLAAVNDHHIMDGQSLLVVAPTSSGKTFVGELAAAKAITEHRKAVFLFPYKALVNEKYDQFQRLYADKLGMRVVRCTGDFSDQAAPFVKGKYDLAVLTYEMFLNLSIANPATLNVLGLVVVDELQFIADSRRGIVVELLITNLLAARQRGIAPQFVGLSAVIGALNSLDNWLGCDKLIREERPVPLVEGVIDRSGTYQYLDADGTEKSTQLLPSHAIIQRKQKPEKQDVIVPLVRSLLAANADERVIVFRNRKGSAQGAAKYLADELQLPPATDAIAALPSNDPSTSLPVLRDCLGGGTAFHTTDLGREERLTVERVFRERGGPVKVLCATTTVAAGINTPASTVILPDQEFLGEEARPFTVAEYKNMAGRAGRLGYHETGRCILIADTYMERQQLFRTYVQGQSEPIRSSFDPAHTETWVLRLLAQVDRVKKTDAVMLLASTFGGFVANLADPGWMTHTIAKLNAFLQQMIDLSLLVEEDGFVRLTLLGRACGNSSLAFPSAMRLVRMLQTHGPGLNGVQLMALVQALPELDGIYTPMMKRGQGESRWTQSVMSLYGRPIAVALQNHAEDGFDFLARCKRATILQSWISGTPMETIEREATVNPFNSIGAGHVRGFADATRFHLRSAASIVTALLIENGPTEQDIESILLQLELGLPADVLDLVSIPIVLDRGEYLLLKKHGVRTAADLWALDVEKHRDLLGKRRASELAGLRP